MKQFLLNEESFYYALNYLKFAIQNKADYEPYTNFIS